MSRSKLALAAIAATLLGPASQARSVNPAVARLAIEYGLQAAIVIAKVLWDKARSTTSEKCVSHVRSASVRDDRKMQGCLALSRTVEVKMEERTGNRILLELRINVEVVALYPLKEVRYVDGEVVLPNAPKILVGFIDPKGKRGTWTGDNDWDLDKCQQVAESLAYKSLEPAKDKFKEFQPVLEYEFKKEVEKEFERLVKSAGKRSVK